MATLDSLDVSVRLQGKLIDANTRTIEEQRKTIVDLTEKVVDLDKYIRENLTRKGPKNAVGDTNE